MTEIEFNVLLLNKKYPFAVYENNVFQEAKYYLDRIEKLKKSKKPFLFLLLRIQDNEEDLYDNADAYYTLLVSPFHVYECFDIAISNGNAGKTRM